MATKRDLSSLSSFSLFKALQIFFFYLLALGEISVEIFKTACSPLAIVGGNLFERYVWMLSS